MNKTSSGNMGVSKSEERNISCGKTSSVPDLAMSECSDSEIVCKTPESSSCNVSLAKVLNVEPHDSQKTEELASHRPAIFGHRGAVYHEPENTIEGFLRTAEIGVEGAELDVFLLKCGTVVVFHGEGSDENPGLLKDYCGVDGSILDYTAEEARSLLSFNENGKVFSTVPNVSERVKDAMIPTLEEVLEVAKETGITVKIELKSEGTPEPALDIVERMGMVDQCHFSSFIHSRIARIRELRPQKHADGTHVYKTGCLFRMPLPENFLEIAKEVDASEVHLRYDICKKQHIDAIHAAGMGSLAWFRGALTMQQDEKKFHDVGNEDVAMYQTVLNSGVQAMVVNKPDVLLSLVEGK